MFNRTTNNYRAGDFKIEVKGVNAPEAARFLNDIEKESAARISEVIFDRLEVEDIKMEWAVAHEISDIKNCHRILIYYKNNGNHEIRLDVIEKDVDNFMRRENVINEIAKDMARHITNHLIMKMVRQ